MTKELLQTLTTGDFVKNTKTGETRMVGVLSLPNINMISIYDITPVEDWELTKSRLVITKEELTKIEEYHKKIKEQQDNARK